MPPSGGTRSRTGSESDVPEHLQTVRKRTLSKTRGVNTNDVDLNGASVIAPSTSIPGIVPNLANKSNAEIWHSTPAGSPTIRTDFRSPLPPYQLPEDEMAGYGITPLAESHGTKLIPEKLPTIDEDSTLIQVNDYLDKINEYVHQYETKLDESPNWREDVHIRYKKLVENISSARLIATDKCNDALIARCSDLLSKLEHAKLKWSSRSHQENSLYSFHGFPSMEDPRTNLPGGSKNPPYGSQASRIGDITKRIADLEHLSKTTWEVKEKLPMMNEMLSKVNPNQVSSLLERVAILEQLSRAADNNKLKELDMQLSSLESRFNQLSSSYESQKTVCNLASNAQRSLVRELTSFKMTVSNAIEHLQNTIEHYTNSSTQNLNGLNPPTANCRVSATGRQGEGPVYTTAGIPFPNNNSVPNWSSTQPLFSSVAETSGLRVGMPGTNPNIPSSSTANKPTHIAGNNSICQSDVSSSTLDIQGRLLKNQMKGLKALLEPGLDQNIPKCTLEDIYKNRLTAIEIKERELSKSLKDYLRMSSCNIQLGEQIADVIEDAGKYASGVRDIYLKEGYHMKSQSSKLYEALPKFTNPSEMHVFEFLRRYDAVAKDFDIPSEKAELLYSKFLSPSIQEEIVRYKGDYNAMRKMLLQRYGNLKTITSNLLLQISRDQIPNNTQDVDTQLTYYRKLQFAFQKINKLLSSPDVPVDEVQDYLFSNDFITHILLYLPQEAENDFIRQLQRLDEDTIRIRGKTAFKVLLSTVNQYYEMFDTSARNKSVTCKSSITKPKKEGAKTTKHANAITCNDCSSGTDTDSDMDGGPSCSIHFQQNKFKKANTPRPVSSYKFPCIIVGHNHSLGECEEFFQISPQQRFEHKKQFKFKYCILCLQSSDECKFKSCANTKSIPSMLKCGDCKAVSKNGDKQVYSILYCFSEKHSKPSNTDIITALEEYVPKFKEIQYKNAINIACHFQVLKASRTLPIAKPKTLTRDLDVDQSVPAFNTKSGTQEEPEDTDIIREANDDSIGIMQLLNIHGRTTLTLFDSGANQNLIDGTLAEDLKIKVHTQEPTAIGVISGGQIWTEYGQYQLALGPTRAGKFFQLLVQGISSVTGTIPNYDLKEVNEEVVNHTDIGEEAILPSYVGGGKIKLLIGLKNAQIEPVCLFTLPSGLGVYRSQFTDIFGSNICFGGPHSSFSQINKQLSSNINHFNAFLLQTFNQYRGSFYPSLIRALEPELIEGECNLMQFKEPDLTYSYQTSTGQKVYPTPLGANDFTELGQMVENECKDDEATCPGPHCECTTLTNAFKAKIPLSRQRDFIDEDDIDSSEGFRCHKCARCRCNTNNRMKMMSLNEAVEQAAIEKSVTVDLNEKKVYVDLPFTKPPGEFLTARHGGDNNYKQAHRVYKSQCRVPEPQKDGLRKVHQELVDKGFLKKLEDLSEEHQKLIENNEFRHYMPWRLYKRPESDSTPVRVVVDPSQTGLNLILAKGENRLSKINDILTRARVRKYIWSSDISKLYNRMILNPTSYAYQLFLYSDKLDPDSPPEIYVMVVAWYGVAPSSNQSGFALEELARLLKDEYPRAYLVIKFDRYVDDILSGSNSESEREKQISEVIHVLSCGGFTTKFVIQSGQPEDDSNILKVLGYKWHILEDKLSPGFKELNFNSKKRGMKNPNPFPVVTPGDVTKLLSSKNVSRRMVISKIAELWEPAGYFEPYKVQLKLAAHALNGLEWDSPLAMDLQEYWIIRFQQFLSIPHLRISRYIFPSDVPSDSKIRLLCLSDAACMSGGAAVYAGIRLEDGSYSCQLLSSRSKLMQESIPRNELNALRIGANLVFDIKNALGDLVSESLFFTDSNIAMAWCMNTKKKLRLYCLNRVTEIRNLLETITGEADNLPIFHIDGNINIADLLTKPNNLKPGDLSENSEWIQGYDWMKLDFKSMPATTFSQLKTSTTQEECEREYFPEVFFPSACLALSSSNTRDLTHCSGCKFSKGLSILTCYGISNGNPHCIECTCNTKFHSFAACKAASGSLMLIDIVKHGYQKSINVMAKVLDYAWSLHHKGHLSRGISTSLTCRKCVGIEESGGIEFEYNKVFRRNALDFFLRKEASYIKDTIPNRKLKEFTLKDGIYYATGRIADDAKVTTKDLDYTVFFDNMEIKGTLPVVSADSQLFFALLIHIHHKVRKHAGNSITLREVMKTVFVINNPMRIIQAVRKNCPRCRLLIRKTLELEMANHPQSRLQISPPFYHVMIDIVYGFKGKVFKRSRTEVKIYGLVVVCLMTSATNILTLEGIETQDVVQALERHSSRYGIPAAIFVDQGTQLTCLEGIKLDLRNINAQLRESVGVEVYPSAPKSHESQGRVERKILTLRDMLKKIAINTNVGMTALQWETIFSKIANEIDEVPIARTDKSTYNDLGWELLTPNRCKLGRSNQRALQGPIYIPGQTSPVDIMQRAEKIQRYWYQLLLDRLHHLIPRPSKWKSTDVVNVDDVVVFRFLDNQSSKLETWRLGRVTEILKNGRRLSINYVVVSDNGKKATTYKVERSPRDVCVVSATSEIDLNSNEFYEKVKKIV